ncbi:MAG TPA: hypothetical protein P5048_02735 [Chlamydiales bacterium]|nr:hypothetical protein [Chlamydiales bacterium]
MLCVAKIVVEGLLDYRDISEIKRTIKMGIDHFLCAYSGRPIANFIRNIPTG